MRRCLGATLVEILISAGLLMLMSGVFFYTVTPIVQKKDWFGEKQDILRGYILAKQKLNILLIGSRLLSQEELAERDLPDDVLLAIARKRTAQTAGLGQLAIVDRREITTYEPASPVFLELDAQGRLKSRAGDNVSLIWALGQDARVEASSSEDARSVTFNFEAVDRSLPSQPRTWRRQHRVYLR